MTKRIFLVFLVVAMLTSCGQKAPTWQEQYDLGIRYLSEGSYEEAIIAFTAAIEIDPNQALAYVGRGDAYVGSGGVEENLIAAQMDYEKAIELDNSSPNTYLKLAELLIQRGLLADAISVLEKGFEQTGMESISDKLEQLHNTFEEQENRSEPPTEVYALTKQSYTILLASVLSDDSIPHPDHESYYTYQYDGNGHLIHSESWHKTGWHWDGHSYSEGYWEQSADIDWSYDKETALWSRKSFNHQSGTEAVMTHEKAPGPLTHIGYNYGATGDNVSITTRPYVKNKEKIVYNSNMSSSGIDWHFAKYTYDENGNAVFIESFSADGTLLGTCELEWELIELNE